MGRCSTISSHDLNRSKSREMGHPLMSDEEAASLAISAEVLRQAYRSIEE
jgi:hypothetical protein